MLIGAMIVEVIKVLTPNANVELYTSMQVYIILGIGVINLFLVCRPFNKYKTLLFTLSAVLVVGIIISSIFYFIPFVNNFFVYTPISLTENLLQVIIVFAIIILSIPISILLQLAFSKVEFNFIKKK
jgi:hypothetical protein